MTTENNLELVKTGQLLPAIIAINAVDGSRIDLDARFDTD